LGERERHLDGIRGAAAVVVAVFHFLRAFAPHSLTGAGVVAFLPASTFWNGHFAVQVFFVLSGFLFFLKFHGRTPREGLAAGVKRYFRLSIPALAVCLVAWALHAGGLFANAAAGELTQSDWLQRWYRFEPAAGLAIFEPLLGMYVSFDALRSYNANLWTIRYELFAVWGVVAAAVAARVLPLPAQVLLLAVAAVLARESYVFAFVVGALLALARIRWVRADVPLWVGVLCLAAGLALGAYRPPAIALGVSWPLVVWPVAAALIIGGVDASRALREALSSRAFLWMGRHSFGLYLVHFVVASSLASWAFLWSRSLALTLAAYAVGTIAAAMAFTRFVDRPSQRLLARFRSPPLPHATDRAVP
jgi:peptidoglycan/LPS O-acetylase OafA/YrhL